jgi:hypothetical protein
MKLLGPEDELLLERARDGMVPSAEDHARIKRKLLVQIGAGVAAGASTVGGAANAAAGPALATGTGTATGIAAHAGGIALGVKAVAVFVLVGAVGAGLTLASRSSPQVLSAPARPVASVRSPAPFGSGPAAAPRAESPPPATAPSAEVVQGRISSGALPKSPPATAEHEQLPSRPLPSASTLLPLDHPRSASGTSPAAALPGPVAETRVASTSDVHGASVSTASASSASSEHPSSVGQEADLLRRADLALKANDPQAALTLLDQHAAEFPHGVLVEERDAERVVVLCALSRQGEAQAVARAFLRDNPLSPLAGRVRASCATP